MSSHPLNVRGQCIASDEELFRNMDHACSLGLPELSRMEPARSGQIALIGSGPSVRGQLDVIRDMQAGGVLIVAIKDTHDWLIERGILPNYAFAVDPQEHRWNCFARKDSAVSYIIASQCHPNMFDHLSDMNVTLCHLYMKSGQDRPRGKMLISGSTTSGLRAISVFYVMGWRRFALFGFDSCLDGEILRVNGSKLKDGDAAYPVTIEPNGEEFWCNPSMALQAHTFQDHYDFLPGVEFEVYGHGLIKAIVDRRERNAREIAAAREHLQSDNGRISFIHSRGMDSASYRYRAQIPAWEMGALLNDITASTLIFSKIEPAELMQMAVAKARGQWVIADFCDDHFDWMHYQEALRLADAVTCSTDVMRERIKAMGRDAVVIPDPWEYPLEAPHCQGDHILWFGHHVNRAGLQRILPEIEHYPLHVVGNFGGAIPWSRETMLREFAGADIVILPATEEYKSANRAVESIRQGCFVVAEPHPAWNDIPGIWIGNIKEGIEWAIKHPWQANQRTSLAASHVTEKYSPKTVTAMWRTAIQRPTTSAVGEPIGVGGST